MKIVTKDEVVEQRGFFIEQIKAGKVFIYGTDTIYGIGCSALKEESVRRIRLIKKRDEKPFSVIAPSIYWIRKKCFIHEKAEKWLEKLPGPFTLILELRDWQAVESAVNEGRDTLGVRIPNHWFSKIVEEAGVPFVTTSVNITGEAPMENVDDLSDLIKKGVDYVIDEGELKGKPSTIVNLVGDREYVIR